jgi:hypothetical protein
MASLLGLGGISEKIQAIVQKVRQPIEKAIDWVIGKAVAFAKKIGGKLGFGKDKKGKDNKEDKSESEKKHAEMGNAALQELEKKPPKDMSYEDVRTVKEKQAKTLEDTYNKQLEKPVKMTITFKSPEEDKKDGDMDFHIHIGPNDFDVPGKVSDAADKDLVVPIYRGIHFLKAENHNDEDEKKYQEELAKSSVGKPTYSAAALELAGSKTFDGADVEDKKALEDAVTTVKAELKKKESKGEEAKAEDVISWWRPKQNFDSQILALLQRYINSYGEFKKELKAKNKEAYKELSFSEIPFISTSWRAKHPIKYALGASLAKELQPRRREASVAGRVFVYLFHGKDLKGQNVASVKDLQAADKIKIDHRKLHQEEVTFSGGIPGENLVKQHDIIWDISPVPSDPTALDRVLGNKAAKLAIPIEQDAQTMAEEKMKQGKNK